MEFLAEYGLFLAKSVTILVVFVLAVVALVSAGARQKLPEKGYIDVVKLNDEFTDMQDAIKHAVMTDEQRKAEKKADKKAQKAKKKSKDKDATDTKPRLFVLDFDGDIKASDTDDLREEISAILMLATPADEVLLRLESGGGMVHSYGFAASQLSRITSKGIPLTASVDMVAASGGYMMACVANKIIAAPFAVLGSIGVVAQLPNFHRLLQKNSIDVELLTAGEHKRTLTMLGENTEKGRQKFIEDLEDTHELFKQFVSEHRQVVDIAKVANGDVWYGQRALDVCLIDELGTSDEYLMSRLDSHDIYEVSFEHKKSLPEKLGMSVQLGVDKLLMTWWQRLNINRFFS